MTQDEEGMVDPTEPVEPNEPQEPAEPTEPQEPQEDYRGKLNATNNFLKKEGYAFDEAKKQWVKPAPPAHRENCCLPARYALDKSVVKDEPTAAGSTYAEGQVHVWGDAML